jgi:site-specific recombinase XerD
VAQVTTRAPAEQALTNSYRVLRDSFRRYLLAANRSARTIQTYISAVDEFGRYLAGQGMPMDVANIRREHVESLIRDLLVGHKPATVSLRYRALQVFWKYLVDEGEIRESPMARMTPPIVPEEPPPVLRQEQLDRLLKSCDGRDFMARRDKAILSLFIDTGMRRSELAYLRVEDVDFDHNVAHVLGKGRRPRGCAFGHRTAMALDRYLRERAKHGSADRPELWLGHAGPLTDNGVYQAVVERARAAGLDVHPHQLRHTFAHLWLAGGGNEGDLMMLTGWRSRSMLSRYGASAAAERAREAHRHLGPVDRLGR